MMSRSAPARIMKQSLLSAILISGVVSMFLVGSLPAQEIAGKELLTADVEGTAVVRNNDLARARDEAIRDALQNAVDKAEAELSGRGQTNKPKRFSAEKYVRSYRILSEKQAGVVYRVDVSAVVDAALLFDDTYARKAKQPPTKITLTVRGITNYTDYGRIRDYLDLQVKHCGRLSPKTIAWQRVDFELDLCESTEIFADTLGRRAPVAMNIGRVAADTIEVELAGGK
jgi:hypothetical protein